MWKERPKSFVVWVSGAYLSRGGGGEGAPGRLFWGFAGQTPNPGEGSGKASDVQFACECGKTEPIHTWFGFWRAYLSLEPKTEPTRTWFGFWGGLFEPGTPEPPNLTPQIPDPVESWASCNLVGV